MAAFSITAEELMAQSIAAVKAKGIELGKPLSDEDALAFVDPLANGLREGLIVVPESQAQVDEMLSQFVDIPDIETFEWMATLGAPPPVGTPIPTPTPTPITAEELVGQTDADEELDGPGAALAAFKAAAAERAAELGQTDFYDPQAADLAAAFKARAAERGETLSDDDAFMRAAMKLEVDY